MGLQLIFVVETNRKCKSDWIYIKDTIEYFYQLDQFQHKLTPVYMDGKGNYRNKEKEINTLISQYASTSKKNKSKVLYCVDCDNYDVKQEDADFLLDLQRYCNEKDAEFIWFCKDVESVYLGKKIEDGKKKDVAGTFKAKKLIKNVSASQLSYSNYQVNTSNIINILNTYLTRKIPN